MNTTSMPDVHRSGARPPRHPGRRGVPVAPLLSAVVVVALAAADHFVGLRPNAFDDEITGPGYLLSFVLSWWAWVPVTVILLMEWWAPAERPDRARRVGIAADLLWAALQIMVWTPVVLLMLRGLSALFEGPLSMLRLDVSDVLPTPVLVIVGFALGDLIRWFVHFQFHRHDRLWRIHQVHHTQDHMSMWTDFRSHPVEVFARELTVALPFFVLGGVYSTPIGVLGFAYLWYSVFYHGNIAWNLGPLRWIVVTPQSHRVHHSADPTHFDTNFGNFFSFWDRAFGTACPDATIYPPTGLGDTPVPMEHELTVADQTHAYLAQLAYPFR